MVEIPNACTLVSTWDVAVCMKGSDPMERKHCWSEVFRSWERVGEAQGEVMASTGAPKAECRCRVLVRTRRGVLSVVFGSSVR